MLELFLAAILPGLFAALSSRPLLRQLDDPAFPERYQQHLRRTLMGAFFVTVGLMVLSEVSWWLWLAAFGATALGNFPLRRRVLGETWHAGAYALHALASLLAFAGFAFAVAFAPAFLLAVPEAHLAWATALALLILGAWKLSQTRLFLWLLQAEPLARPDLDEALDAIARRAQIPSPPRFAIGPSVESGGRWANAVALPRGPAVAFSRTLLAELSPDEIAGIFGHELAHLEHHDRRELRRASYVEWALIAGSLALAPFVRWTAIPWADTMAIAIWVMATFTIVNRSARHRRDHEAESDRRAVELTGDPEALVRALVALHRLGGMPRRVGAQEEEVASHPSLARRIQTIRALGHAGVPPDEESWTVVVPGSQPGAFVVLTPHRSAWLERVPPEAAASGDAGVLQREAGALRSHPHRELSELRLAPRGKDLELVARDLRGQRWSVVLGDTSPELLAAVQGALDRVDGKLGHTRDAPRLVRLGSVLGLLLVLAQVLVAPTLSGSLVGLATLIRPRAGTLILLAALTLGALLGEPSFPAELIFGPAWAFAPHVAGALALLTLASGVQRARFAPGDPAELVQPALVVSLILAAFFPLVALARSLVGDPLEALHQSAADTPSAAALLAATILLFLDGRPGRRVAAVVAGAVAAGVVALGSMELEARTSSDPLAGPGLPVTTGVAALEPLWSAELRERATALELSPDGRWALLSGLWRESELDELEEPFEDEPLLEGRLRALSADGTRHDLTGSKAAFAGDHALLVLSQRARRAELRAIDLSRGTTPLWRRSLPDGWPQSLRVDAHGRFELWVRSSEPRGPVRRVTGSLEDPTLAIAELTAPALGHGALYTLPGGEHLHLALDVLDPERAGGYLRWFLQLGATPPTLVHRVGDEATQLFSTRAMVTCADAALGEEVFCVAVHGQAARVFRLSPGTPESQVELPGGPRYGAPHADRGRLLLTDPLGRPELLDVQTQQLWAVPVEAGSDLIAATHRAGRIAILTHHERGDRTVVTVSEVKP